MILIARCLVFWIRMDFHPFCARRGTQLDTLATYFCCIPWFSWGGIHCRRTYPVAANGDLCAHINFAIRTRFVADIDKTKTKLALRKRRTFN